jgi:AcrR family transcriptional regulator
LRGRPRPRRRGGHAEASGTTLLDGARGAAPRRSTGRRRHRARRTRILKAAREIFFRDGFADTNLDEVASRAEVGKGTLYRHFESKAELYVAVLAAGGTAFDDAMREAAERGTSSLERLRSIGRFYRSYWSERPEYFFIFSVLQFPAFVGQLSPSLLAEVRSIWERPLRRLEQVIAEGVRRGELRRCDPWVMANVIWRDNPNSTVVVMDGGGNDILIPAIAFDPYDCMTQWWEFGRLSSSCKALIDDIYVDGVDLINDLQAKGITEVIFLGYYYTKNGLILADDLKEAIDYGDVRLRQACVNSVVPCTFIDPRSTIRDWDITVDGVHPNTNGSLKLANLIWPVLQPKL